MAEDLFPAVARQLVTDLVFDAAMNIYVTERVAPSDNKAPDEPGRQDSVVFAEHTDGFF